MNEINNQEILDVTEEKTDEIKIDFLNGLIENTKYELFNDGIVICADCLSQEILDYVSNKMSDGKGCIVTDPPYGGILNYAWDGSTSVAALLPAFLKSYGHILPKGFTSYVFGGVGTYRNRTFLKLAAELEDNTTWYIHNFITWGKRRAYGTAYNYLFTREEILFLVNGQDRPIFFDKPYLDEKRGYEGYNKDYPAHSEMKRRTNVWSDITELFSGKLHDAEKPLKLLDVMIKASCPQEGIVLDPFAGSGTTGLSARSSGRKFILIEKSNEAYNLTCARLRGEPKEKLLQLAQLIRDQSTK